jgi:hypothetical protein
MKNSRRGRNSWLSNYNLGWGTWYRRLPMLICAPGETGWYAFSAKARTLLGKRMERTHVASAGPYLAIREVVLR